MKAAQAGALAILTGLLLAGCGATPRPSAANPSTSPPPTFPPPSVSAPPGPTATASRGAGVAIHTIPVADTTPLLATATDGTEIVWSRGVAGDTSGSARELVSFTPATGQYTVVYRAPNADAQLAPISVHGGRYAVVETYTRSNGTTGWRVELIQRAGAPAQLLDSTELDPVDLATPLAWVTLTRTHVVWSAVHDGPTGPRSYLRDYSLVTGKTTDLAVADASATEYWFPDADDAGDLVYATVDHSGTTDAFRVYARYLDDPAVAPKRLDADGQATSPLVNGTTVVWKQTSNNVASWCGLVRYDRATGRASQIFFAGQGLLNYPTVGNRFVAAWGYDDTEFAIYDLATDTTLEIEHYPAASAEGVVRPVVGGNLLVFIRGTADSSKPLQLCWAVLPS